MTLIMSPSLHHSDTPLLQMNLSFSPPAGRQVRLGGEYVCAFATGRVSSIDAYDFDMFADPVRRKINPPAVAALFDFLLDHLLAIDFKFRLLTNV
jgi:hypothetical protein